MQQCAIVQWQLAICKQTMRLLGFHAGPQKGIEQRLEEMRALLAERRDHLPLWHAYGQQLYKVGQAKVTMLAFTAQHLAMTPQHLSQGCNRASVAP